MITLAEAQALKHGEILHDSNGRRWKVNGAVKLWKTMPERVRVPLKHGLYGYDVITEADFTEGVCNYLTKGEPSQCMKHRPSRKQNQVTLRDSF